MKLKLLDLDYHRDASAVARGAFSDEVKGRLLDDLVSLENDGAALEKRLAAGRNGSDPETSRLRREIRARLGSQAPPKIVRFEPGWHQDFSAGLAHDRTIIGPLNAPASDAPIVTAKGSGWSLWTRFWSFCISLKGRSLLSIEPEGAVFDAARDWVVRSVRLDAATMRDDEEFLLRARRALRPLLPQGAMTVSADFPDSVAKNGSKPTSTVQNAGDGMLSLFASAPVPEQEQRQTTLRVFISFAGGKADARIFVRALRQAGSLHARDGAVPQPTVLHALSALLDAWLHRPGLRPWSELIEAVTSGAIDASTLADLASRRAQLSGLPPDERELVAATLPGIVEAASWEDVVAHARSVVAALRPERDRRKELAAQLCARVRLGTIHEVRTVLAILAEAGGRESVAGQYARALTAFLRVNEPTADAVGCLLDLIEEKLGDPAGCDASVVGELAVAAKRQRLAGAFEALAPVVAARRELSGDAVPLLTAAANALAVELPAVPAGVWQTAAQQAGLLSALEAFRQLRSKDTGGQWKCSLLDYLAVPLPRDPAGNIDRFPAAWWRLAGAWLHGVAQWPAPEKFAYAIEVADGLFAERWLGGKHSLQPLGAWLRNFLGDDAGKFTSLVAGRWLLRRFDAADDGCDLDRLAALLEWQVWQDGDARAAALARRWNLPAGASALRDRWGGCMCGAFLEPKTGWQDKWIALLWHERLVARRDSTNPWIVELERWPAAGFSQAAWNALLDEVGPQIVTAADASELIAGLAKWGRPLATHAADLDGWKKLLDPCSQVEARKRNEFLLALLRAEGETASRAALGFWPVVPAKLCLDRNKGDLGCFIELSVRLRGPATPENDVAVAAVVAQKIDRASALDDRVATVRLLGTHLPGAVPALARDVDLFEGVLAELLLAHRNKEFFEIEAMARRRDDARRPAQLRVAARVIDAMTATRSPDLAPLEFVAEKFVPTRAKVWKAIAREQLGAEALLGLARSLLTMPEARVKAEFHTALWHEATLSLHRDGLPERSARLAALTVEQITH